MESGFQPIGEKGLLGEEGGAGGTEAGEDDLMTRIVRGFWKVFDRVMGIESPGKEEEQEHFRDWGP